MCLYMCLVSHSQPCIVWVLLQVRVETHLVQRTVIPKSRLSQDKIAEQLTTSYHLQATPEVTMVGSDASGSGEVGVRLSVQYASDLQTLAWPGRRTEQGVLLPTVESGSPKDDFAAAAEGAYKQQAEAEALEGEQVFVGVTLPAVPAVGVGAILHQRLFTLLTLLQEVNTPQLPHNMLLIYEGLDYKTSQQWQDSTYRLVFLCGDSDSTPCTSLHEGYSLRQVSAVRVVWCVLLACADVLNHLFVPSAWRQVVHHPPCSTSVCLPLAAAVLCGEVQE